MGTKLTTSQRGAWIYANGTLSDALAYRRVTGLKPGLMMLVSLLVWPHGQSLRSFP